MPRNSFGTYSLPSGNPVIADTVIEADGWANPTLQDIGTEITGSLPRNGAAGMSGVLKVADGAVGAPGVSFANALTTGMWRNGSNIAWSVTGTKRAEITTTGLDITGNFSVSGTTLLTGAVTFTGSIAAVNGVFSGNLTAVNGTYSGVASYTTNDGRGIELNRNSAGNLAHLAGFAGGNGAILSAGARYDSPANWVAEDTKGSAIVLQATGALPSVILALNTGATLGAVPPWQNAMTVGLSLDGAAQNTGHAAFSGNAIQLPVGTTTQRPAAPVTGDMRYNSTLSVAEIYTGSAWVAIFTSTNGEKRNFLINGGMDVWQRGTTIVDSATVSKFYTADRWGFNRSGDVAGTTISQAGSPGVGTRYSLIWQRTLGNASTAQMAMFYTLETADSMALAGKTVTLSFWATKGANYSGGQLTVGIYYGTGTDQRVYAFTGITTAGATTFTLTTSWAKYSLAGVAIPGNATEVGLQFSWVPTGVAGAADDIFLTAMQLEVSPVATDFMSRPFQQELALCQRYYEKTFNYATVPAQAAGNQTPGAIMSMSSGTTVLAFWAYKVSKRTIPTITTYNPTQANANWRNTVNTADTAVSIGASGENSCVLQAGASSDIVGYQINAAADAEL